MYELKELPVAQAPAQETASYITREEFEQVINQLKIDLQPQTPKMNF